jgi:hypothetical protein
VGNHSSFGGLGYGAVRLLHCARNDKESCHCEERSDEAISPCQHFLLNQTTGHWNSVAQVEKTQAVRSERSRASGEVEECNSNRATGLRLRSATLRPNGVAPTAGEEVYQSYVV